MPLPDLMPGWEYRPFKGNPDSQLDKLVGVTQFEDMPLIIVDGRAAVFWEIVKSGTDPIKPLAMYEHLIFRLNKPRDRDNGDEWTTMDVFVSSHIPGDKHPQVALAGTKLFVPPLVPNSAAARREIVEWIDGPEFEQLADLIWKNMRLAPYFKKHVRNLPTL